VRPRKRSRSVSASSSCTVDEVLKRLKALPDQQVTRLNNQRHTLIDSLGFKPEDGVSANDIRWCLSQLVQQGKVRKRTVRRGPDIRDGVRYRATIHTYVSD